jgi:hypothetical protein
LLLVPWPCLFLKAELDVPLDFVADYLTVDVFFGDILMAVDIVLGECAVVEVSLGLLALPVRFGWDGLPVEVVVVGVVDLHLGVGVARVQLPQLAPLSLFLP